MHFYFVFSEQAGAGPGAFGMKKQKKETMENMENTACNSEHI